MADSRKVERREVEVSAVEITAFCHATENCMSVEQSIKNVLHSDLRNQVKVSYQEQKGYYGNPIVILSTKISSKQQIDLLLQYLASALEAVEKSILKTTFDLRYDPRTNRFIVRFSKQDLYHGGKLKVADTDDVVKVVIYFKNVRGKQSVLEYLKNIKLIE